MGPRSPEAKLARKIEEALNVFEFNDSFCAYMLHRAHGKVQARLFNIFMNLVYHWAEDLENGHFDSDTYDMTVNAKRIQETMERFGYTLKE
jgi:hypothetical protein